MTNQQKIEFYLNKGFAVEVEYENGKKAVVYYATISHFYGLKENENDFAMDKDGALIETVTKVTPIPPKPYEFKEYEKVIVLIGSSKGIIGEVDSYCDGDVTLRIGEEKQLVKHWWELAPALPEEECEVMKVTEVNYCIMDGELHPCYQFTKPNGKKLIIKVVIKK